MTDPSSEPNSRTAEFDLALPGSQPVFQYATLIPAIRAAIILGCNVQTESRFDRKHYFYHDQPSGYQITQYYYPLAKNGIVILDSDDGLHEGEQLVIGIKQVQLEQDTARTQDQDAGVSLVDFNRAGHPLIEIISLPQIHSPRVAAAYVRKIQALLSSVDAVTTGMDLGGLRADVNVSVRRAGDVSKTSFSYGGISGLGQRTEIKNLGTIKGVEDAIHAERDRQIASLEAGGVVEGETRGWSLTKPNETRRLRGKEGEVDYRYMPDPDLPPLHIGADLIEHIGSSLPPVPEELVSMLVNEYGLSRVDAWAMLALDEGMRLNYYQDVVEGLEAQLGLTVTVVSKHFLEDTGMSESRKELRRLTANWVLHELGALLTTHERSWSEDIVPAKKLSDIIAELHRNELTTISAKTVLKNLFEGDERSIGAIVDAEGLRFNPLSSDEYRALAEQVVRQFPDHVRDIVEKGKQGKVKFLLGQMMRAADKGRVEASAAEQSLRARLFDPAP